MFFFSGFEFGLQFLGSIVFTSFMQSIGQPNKLFVVENAQEILEVIGHSLKAFPANVVRCYHEELRADEDRDAFATR
jgi:hypothetical protein